MNTEFHEILVRNMKLYRSNLGISQMELAERAGLSSGYVGEIETGRKFPSPEALIQLATALEVKPYRLLMGAEDVAEWTGDEAFYAAKDEVVETRQDFEAGTGLAGQPAGTGARAQVGLDQPCFPGRGARPRWRRPAMPLPSGLAQFQRRRRLAVHKVDPPLAVSGNEPPPAQGKGTGLEGEGPRKAKAAHRAGRQVEPLEGQAYREGCVEGFLD